MNTLTVPTWAARLRPANWLFLTISMAGLAAFLYPFWTPIQVSPSETRMLVLLVSGAAASILLALLGEAQAGLTAHTIAMLGTLVGLNTALRVLDTIVPLPGGFSPVFLLILLVGHAFGARLGFLMGALTLLVSDPLTAGGLGPWTPYQMLAAGWVGMGAAFLPRGRGRVAALAIYGAAWGYLYGALTNLYFWPYTLLAPDLAWQPGLPASATLARYGRFYVVTSLAWDSMRALGNLLLVLLLARPLLEALERFRRRTHVTWEPA